MNTHDMRKKFTPYNPEFDFVRFDIKGSNYVDAQLIRESIDYREKELMIKVELGEKPSPLEKLGFHLLLRAAEP